MRAQEFTIEVPYNKVMLDGSVEFTVRWVPYRKATATAPAEGGNFETVKIEGPYFDDDLPDLEADAFTEAAEMVAEYIDHVSR